MLRLLPGIFSCLFLHFRSIHLHFFSNTSPDFSLLWLWLTHGSCIGPRSGELRTQKLKSHLVRTQSLNVLPLKPGVGQYIAIHATLTARDFFLLISTLPVHSPAFCPNLSQFFPVLAVANTWFLCRPAE